MAFNAIIPQSERYKVRDAKYYREKTNRLARESVERINSNVEKRLKEKGVL